MKKLISVVLALALVLSLSAVAFAYEAPAGVNSLAIVGQDIPGVGNWNPADAAGDFELVADNVYEKVIEVTAATTMTVKFAGNDKWDDSCNLGGSYNGDPITIGEVKNLTNGSGAQNMSLTVDEACTLKFTVDMTAGVNAATVLVEKVVEEEDGGDTSSAVTLIEEKTVTILASNWSGEMDTFTPETDGVLTVTVVEANPGWCWLWENTAYENETVWGDYGVENSNSINVTAGVAYTIHMYGYDPSTETYADGTVTYYATFTSSGDGTGSETPAGPGSSENDPIVFTDGNYLATVPSNTTLWFAFDDYNDYWNNGIYAQQFNIMGNTGYTVTYSYGSMIVNDDMGVVSGEAFCNMQGKYVFSIANNTDSEQNYIVAFSDIPSEDESGPLASVTDEAVTATAPWTFTFTAESTGVLNVQVSDNVAFKIFGLEGADSESLRLTASSWSAGTDSDHVVTVPGEITVMVWCWGGSAVGEIDGNISCTLTFTPDEVEVTKEEYVVSDVLLGLGENDLTLDENAYTTVYEFCPDETGVYVFTVNNESALVGYWGGGSFFVWDQTENKTFTLEQELTSVGQSIMVGVSGVEGEFTMTIEKKGASQEIVQKDYVDYVNTHIPGDFEIEMNDGDKLVNVDITKPQTAVLGTDGFYHLGTANGPVLYVDLISDAFDMSGAWGGYGALTMRGEYVDADGVSHYYDFLDAMYMYNQALNADGMYPLTEDLAIYIKAFGGYQGWYMPSLSSFDAIKAGDFNEDSAWLVTCYYVEPAVTEDEGTGSNPETGDMSIAGLAVAMMAATAGAVVIGKKKEF